MKILIIGATGFSGKSITSLFRRKGLEFYTVSRSDKKSNWQVDISYYEQFSKLPVDFFDTVINCATVLPGGNYLDNDYLKKIFNTNILGTQNICKWIKGQSKIKKIINCSTLVVVDKPWPLNLTETEKTYPIGNHVLYCSSKLTQELIFKTFSNEKEIKICQVRFSALYGEEMPKEGIIHHFINQAKNDKRITLKNGSKVSADFIHVDDAAQLILALIGSDFEGTLNAASGNELSLLELANIISSKVGKDIEVVNHEDENFIENRALINVDKLNNIIDTSRFINISAGI
ncbi:NAD-dependent epimerase/dehydratase family protein [Halpernia sp. GG3]